MKIVGLVFHFSIALVIKARGVVLFLRKTRWLVILPLYYSSRTIDLISPIFLRSIVHDACH